MKEFEITNSSLNDKVKIMERWLKTRFSESVTILDKDLGDGGTFIKELERGLLIQAWDGLLKNDLRVFCRPVEETAPLVWMINFFIMPEPCMIETGEKESRKVRKMTLGNSQIISTNRSRFAFITKSGARIRDFDIIFTNEWLLKHYPLPAIEKFLATLEEKGQDNLMRKPVSPEYFIIVNELLETVFKDEWDIVFLKGKVMTLLNETLANLIVRGTKEKPPKANDHMPVMIEIERKLVSMLHEKMPNLDEIAKEFFMSESTLKRQFKQSYGKAVYEYYLDKKMELAKNILLDNNLTITQVSYSLGYEKPSSFIKTFKKYFAISPGALRNERA